VGTIRDVHDELLTAGGIEGEDPAGEHIGNEEAAVVPARPFAKDQFGRELDGPQGFDVLVM